MCPQKQAKQQTCFIYFKTNFVNLAQNNIEPTD